MRLFALLVVFGVLQGTTVASEGREKTLGDWLAKNNPRVTSFLAALRAEQRGSKLKGIVLTDQTKVLGGYTYVGQLPDAGPGAHVYLFSRSRRVVAYLWVDRGGAPLSLPKCPVDEPEPATVLSGDIYTWKQVQPGDSVVVFECRGKPSVLTDWVRRARATTQAQ
jgi:hypothetical protein